MFVDFSSCKREIHFHLVIVRLLKRSKNWKSSLIHWMRFVPSILTELFVELDAIILDECFRGSFLIYAYIWNFKMELVIYLLSCSQSTQTHEQLCVGNLRIYDLRNCNFHVSPSSLWFMSYTFPVLISSSTACLMFLTKSYYFFGCTCRFLHCSISHIPISLQLKNCC